MQKEKAKDLLIKYKEGNCTAEEQAIVERWILYGYPEDIEINEDALKEDLSEISQRLFAQPKIRTIRWWPQITAAAVVLMVCSISLYFHFNQRNSVQVVQKIQPAAIVPGGNNAILTLANGSKVILNSAANGEIAKQAGISITKATDGQLIYQIADPASTEPNSRPLYNTIETPKGGQYQIKLPDGTHVWLNAASSLRFPAAFTGNIREVELAGEGYFEVAKNAKMPFHVISNNQVVEVLGTHFNINSYEDEASVNTTLLEGSVRIVSGAAEKSIVLKPGQQALNKNSMIHVQSVDTEAAVAWKNGLFQFNNTDLKTVMRQLSRWYNVSIRYEGSVPDEKFGGAIERSLQLTEVFEILEKSKVRFRIEGREVVVMP